MRYSLQSPSRGTEVNIEFLVFTFIFFINRASPAMKALLFFCKFLFANPNFLRTFAT